MPYKDPEKRKAASAKGSATYYEKNKEAVKARTKKKRKQQNAEWRAFKATLSCSQCGFSHPAAMDFHHTNKDDKEGGVHEFARMRNYKKAYEEIKKCIVLCANCHRIVHYTDHYQKKAAKKAKKNGAEAP